jgi:hypothetical protein
MYDVLERLLHDESAEPRELPLSLLRAITNDFDDARKIGEDGYFELYKVRVHCMCHCRLHSVWVIVGLKAALKCEYDGRVCFEMEKSWL